MASYERRIEDSDLLHFSGRWTPDERALIARAVAVTEAMLPANLRMVRPPGSPWVCSKHEHGGYTLFFAHRLGLRDVYAGQTAEHLAERLTAACAATSPAQTARPA